MLFKASQLDGIADGTITLTFRRWDAPRVRAGGQQRTRIGVIEFDSIERVDDLSDEEARRAGWASREAVLKQFASRSGDLYRIELHLAGARSARGAARAQADRPTSSPTCAAASSGWARGR